MKPSKETKTQTPNLGDKFTSGGKDTQNLPQIREQTSSIVCKGKTITFVLTINMKNNC